MIFVTQIQCRKRCILKNTPDTSIGEVKSILCLYELAAEIFILEILTAAQVDQMKSRGRQRLLRFLLKINGQRGYFFSGKTAKKKFMSVSLLKVRWTKIFF